MEPAAGMDPQAPSDGSGDAGRFDGQRLVHPPAGLSTPVSASSTSAHRATHTEQMISPSRAPTMWTSRLCRSHNEHLMSRNPVITEHYRVTCGRRASRRCGVRQSRGLIPYAARNALLKCVGSVNPSGVRRRRPGGRGVDQVAAGALEAAVPDPVAEADAASGRARAARGTRKNVASMPSPNSSVYGEPVWTEVKVDTENPERGPLLIISGEKDHTVPWAIANASYKQQKDNPGVTEIVELPGRGHSLTIDSGWREVCDTALSFVQRFQ
jgi:hypothetical protein